MNILDQICKIKLEEIDLLKKKINFTKSPKVQPKKFLEELVKVNKINFNVIAEIKKRSPSKGLIRKDFKLCEIAKEYQNAGAKCLSILTEKNYFEGDITYIKKVKEKVDIPILRKDFILDEWQIFESFYSGADCILLILAILDDDKLKKFYNLSQELGMDVICEVHNTEELERTLKLNVRCIGINNRNLKTLEINPENFDILSKKIPNNIIKICESGINSNKQLYKYSKNGADAFLIGETLMKSENIEIATKNLIKK
jgi:indole-3-glycerol phosphate synthase